jgi:hypothetical protein
MGGIIRGFLGGAGNAMAQFGQMQFAKDLQTERDESEFLRNKALNKEKRGYQTDERLAGEEFTASESALDRASREGIVESKAKADKKEGEKPTNQMKNVEYLMKRGGLTFEGAMTATFKNATIEYTDNEGNLTAVVVTPDGHKKVYSLKQNDAGVVEVLQPGEKSTRTRSTVDERTLVAKTMSKEDGSDNDFIPGNEWNQNDPEVKKRTEEELASSQSNNRNPVKTSGTEESKNVGGRPMTKKRFLEMMTKRYGKEKLSEIEETWMSIK